MKASNIITSTALVILFVTVALAVCYTLKLIKPDRIAAQNPLSIVSTTYDESQQLYQVQIFNDYALGLQKEQSVNMTFSINGQEYKIDLEEWSSDVPSADYGYTDESTYYIEAFDCATPSLDGWLADNKKSTIKLLYMGQKEPTIKISSITQNGKELLKQPITN